MKKNTISENVIDRWYTKMLLYAQYTQKNYWNYKKTSTIIQWEKFEKKKPQRDKLKNLNQNNVYSSTKKYQCEILEFILYRQK